MKPSGIITLTTDFGLRDPYAGVMKGAILSIHAQARIMDITHQIEPGSIVHGAGVIQEAYPFFPEGTVHAVVVDPGVGSSRRPILVQANDHFFVGPDNGLFWPIISSLEPVRVIHLTETKYFLPSVSSTFHGRDVFAPVAAHLSRGENPRGMGSAITDPVEIPFPRPGQDGEVLWGQVMRVDHFGNLITNILRKDLEGFLGDAQPVIRVGGLLIRGMRGTYAHAGTGEPLALIGSFDSLEIAVNSARACDHLGVDSHGATGSRVEVRRAGDSDVRGSSG